MLYSYFDKDDPYQSAAQYVGMTLFSGKLAGKQGTFVLQDNRSFKSGVVHSDIQILENSGTAELKNITGAGKYSADQNRMNMELEYYEE